MTEPVTLTDEFSLIMENADGVLKIDSPVAIRSARVRRIEDPAPWEFVRDLLQFPPFFGLVRAATQTLNDMVALQSYRLCGTKTVAVCSFSDESVAFQVIV